MSQTDATVTASDPCHAAAVHVGTPSPDFNDWEITKVYFHDFASLHVTGDVGGDRVASSTFSCLGCRWHLWLEFTEDDEYGNDKLWLDFFLENWSQEDMTMTVKYGIAIKDYYDQKVYEFEEPVVDIEAYWNHRWSGLITRQKALNSLVHGTLVVEVRMKRPKYPSHPFIPLNPSVCDTIETLFMEKETADVTFEVGGGKQAVALGEVDAGVESNGEKTMKQSTDDATESKTFFAHSLILKKAAPLLAEMCSSDDAEGAPSTVHIPNVQPDTFFGLLHYIYGLDIPDFGADVSHTKEIIEAADRYGLSNLKLEAEVCYVSSMEITLENVMEHLHFADSKNCALLKETIMDFIVENKVDILEKSVMRDAPIDLINDILAAIVRVENKGRRDYVSDLFSVMSISELREKAEYEGVEIDGSRETLIASLKQVQAANEDEDEEEEDDEGEEVGGEEAGAVEVEE